MAIQLTSVVTFDEGRVSEDRASAEINHHSEKNEYITWGADW